MSFCPQSIINIASGVVLEYFYPAKITTKKFCQQNDRHGALLTGILNHQIINILGRGREQNEKKDKSSCAEAEGIFKGLSKAVIAYDKDKSVEFAKAALEKGVDPTDAILKGLAHGMEKVVELFEQQEYFVPEMLACADALNAAVEILYA